MHPKNSNVAFSQTLEKNTDLARVDPVFADVI